MNAPSESFPLAWPVGWPRTRSPRRSAFKGWTNYSARTEITDELKRLGARVLACDKWDRCADNMVALAKHVEAIRGQLRWGVGSLEQAFGGYRALPAVAAKRQWWEVLGVAAHASTAEVEAKRIALLDKCHPDRGGGDVGRAQEINVAWDEFRRERGLVT